MPHDHVTAVAVLRFARDERLLVARGVCVEAAGGAVARRGARHGSGRGTRGVEGRGAGNFFCGAPDPVGLVDDERLRVSVLGCVEAARAAVACRASSSKVAVPDSCSAICAGAGCPIIEPGNSKMRALASTETMHRPKRWIGMKNGPLHEILAREFRRNLHDKISNTA